MKAEKMKAGNIKGALLEYIVRELFQNCGFTNVCAVDPFSFEQGGLFYINGKGAAHDADIIMNPPIQMPFMYPTQLLFECKAYEANVGLPEVRNALGLRDDLNEFEIVTPDTLKSREKNKKANVLDNRTRFLYQVGVASVNGFSKPAIEFATNNKIPLLSLSWFLQDTTIQRFNTINQGFIGSLDINNIKNLYNFLKNRKGNLDDQQYQGAKELLDSGNDLDVIVKEAKERIKRSYVGLLENGDMIFLVGTSEKDILKLQNGFAPLRAEIHRSEKKPEVWNLSVYINNQDKPFNFDFIVPERILYPWITFNYNRSKALDIKQEFFSKVFVFNQRNDAEIPFSIININRDCLDKLRGQLEDK